MSEEMPKTKKERKYKDPSVPVKYAFIDRVAEIPETAFAKRKFYPRELKIAHILFQKYTLDFWTKVNFDYKMKSVAFLLDGRGAEELEKKWKEFNFIPLSSVTTTYEDKKLGEDAQVVKQPKLLDFLKRKS